MSSNRRKNQAKRKRLKFKARIRREYQKYIDAGMDPFVAKQKIMRTRRETASFLTMDQLRTILYRPDPPL